jgi:hypothetical protein
MRLSHPRGTFVSEWFASLRASGARVSLAQWIESLPEEILNEHVVQLVDRRKLVRLEGKRVDDDRARGKLAQREPICSENSEFYLRLCRSHASTFLRGLLM